MKKILALMVCMAIMFALAVPVMASEISLPVSPKVTINIDGVRDDGYSEPYTVDSFRENSGATGKLSTAWDDNYIYYYIEVSDTTPNHEHSNSYERDNVEFFLDWNNAKGDDTYNDGNPYWQIRVMSAPNADGMAIEGGGNFSDMGGDVDAIKFVVVPLSGNNLNGGYIIEVAMPLSEASGASLSEGKTIFVDFQVGDNQEDSGRTSQAFLKGDDPDVDNQWQWPHSCRGILTLGAAPAVAAPEPEPVADVGVGGGTENVHPVPAPVVAAPAPVAAPQTGDTAFIMLAIALVGAFVLSRRIIKNRA